MTTAEDGATSPDGERVIVVSHTHWDREWYQPAERFRQRLVALIDELLDTPPAPGAPFLLDGQAVVLEDYLDVRPERASELGTALRDGRLEAGPWFVLADEEQLPRWYTPPPEPLPELITLVMSDSWHSLLSTREGRHLEHSVLKKYLARQRWFASKNAGIDSVSLSPLASDRLALSPTALSACPFAVLNRIT